MTFSQPAAPKQGDSFSLKDHPEWVGALALVYPLTVNPAQKWNEAFEPCETVTADIVLLDRQGPDGLAVRLEDSMVFPKLMVAQLKENIRQAAGGEAVVLGRIGQRPTPRGPAWVFGDYVVGQDERIAEEYIRSNPRHQVAQPAPDPWAAVPATPPPAAQAAPTPPPAAASPGVDPRVAAFLRGKGVDPSAMGADQALMIARTYPDYVPA